MDPIEKKLLADFQQGKKEAFSLLMDKYGNGIYNLLARMISDREEAKDLTQETFLKAYKSRLSFHGDSGFYTWVYKIALNCARDYWRKKKETTPLADVDILSDGVNRTEETVLERLSYQTILQRMDVLEEEYREAVVLRDVLGFTYQEIGAMLDLPEGTVKSRISRGRHRLREELKELHQKREG
jgi:RNA polymerase sigma-70 factor (ECF subfamily)